MDYQEWVNLFGKRSDDTQVRDLLNKAGIRNRIKLGRDDLSTAEDIKGKGMSVIFTDESILRPDDGVAGRAILTAVLMVLQDSKSKDLYTGPLPFGASKGLSQTELRTRLGEPSDINDKYRTDAWLIDGLEIAATYSRDLQSLVELSIAIPDSE